MAVIRTIPGFSANQIFAYFPVWSRCGPNSCDPPLWLSMASGWCAPLLSGNCCCSVSNMSENVRNSIVCLHWEACNLRVTWPAGSHRRCPVEHVGCHTRNRTGTRSGVLGGEKKKKQSEPNASFLQWLDLIRLVDHNLSSAKAQQRTQSRLFRARSAETAHVNKAKPFHLQQKMAKN